MVILVTIIAVCGILSVVLTLALAAAAAAKTAPASSSLAEPRMETAQSILEGMNLVRTQRGGMPVHAG